MKRIKQGLCECGAAPGELSGILITHCHSDHISGLGMMSKYYNVPIYAPRITAGVIARQVPSAIPYIKPFDAGQEFYIGSLIVSSFRTPHDAYDSVGYVVSDGDRSLAVATDLGHVTPEICAKLRGVSAAVIEANHDVDMLKNGPYPYPLKRRIMEDNGHLSNDACAQLAVSLFESGTGQIVLAHLSSENNTPELAYRTVCDLLGKNGCIAEENMDVSIAPRADISEFFKV